MSDRVACPQCACVDRGSAQLHKDGRFPFDKIITYYSSLEEINKAVSDVSAGLVVKPVLLLD